MKMDIRSPSIGLQRLLKMEITNNRSALSNADGVASAGRDFLGNGLLVKCTDGPYIVYPLSVSVQSSFLI